MVQQSRKFGSLVGGINDRCYDLVPEDGEKTFATLREATGKIKTLEDTMSMQLERLLGQLEVAEDVSSR